MDGFSSATFTVDAQGVLRDVLAAQLGVVPQWVTIAAVSDAAAPRRRMLAPEGVTVALQLAVPASSAASPAALEELLAALPASAAFLQAVNAGLAAAGIVARVAGLHLQLGATTPGRPPPPRASAAPGAPAAAQARVETGGVLAGGVVKPVAAAVAGELLFCAAVVLLLKLTPERHKQRCRDGVHRMFQACRISQKKQRMLPPSTL